MTLCFLDGPQSHHKRRVPALTHFWRSLVFMHVPFNSELPNFTVVTYMGAFRCLPLPHSKVTGLQRSPLLVVPSTLISLSYQTECGN